MKDKILDAAETRVRRAGFAEMSFRDLAQDVGIKSASVHYHFPTKPDLGEALVVRYSECFQAALAAVPRDDIGAALDGFVRLYSDALVLNETICLCAMLGAEANGLPARVNSRTKAFFDLNTAWLSALFAQHNIGDGDQKAALLVSALEGSMILASVTKDRAVFEQVAAKTLDVLLQT